MHYFQTYIDGVDFVFIENHMFRNLGSNIYSGNRSVSVIQDNFTDFSQM